MHTYHHRQALQATHSKTIIMCPISSESTRVLGVISAKGPEKVTDLSCSSTSKIVSIAIQDRSLMMELIDAYFEIIHNKQHVLFHQKSFMALYWRNRLWLVLLRSCSRRQVRARAA